MRGLRKYLTPFAPDQSGAVSVLYGLGGMTVILDAGGCAGNVCGFDEPRWFDNKSAIFSAGLRDMDAIMGRDDKLAAKIADAASKIDVSFIALVGTPVPAVIATDYNALSNMVEASTHLPVISVNTNGMELYDAGQEKAYAALYGKFAVQKLDIIPGRKNIIGATPNDAGRDYVQDTLENIKTASAAEETIVASPSGLKAAKLLKERFGTPYRFDCPWAGRFLPESEVSGKRILIVHQHVLADTLRMKLEAKGAHVTCLSWFKKVNQLFKETDLFIKEEDDFEELVRDGSFDIIIADSALKVMAKDFKGLWVDAPHFALSGRFE